MVDIQTLSIVLAACSFIIAASYYMVTLRNQEKARQAQLFMSIYQETQTKEAQTDFLEIVKIEMKTIDDWIRLQEDREMFSILAKRLSYYEGIGVLIEDGLIDIGLVAKLSSGNIISFWERFGDGVKAIREYYNWPRWAIMVEYLYDQVIKYSEKHPELMITIPENR